MLRCSPLTIERRHLFATPGNKSPSLFQIMATGYWLLATGYWLLATGYWLLATGYWLLGYSATRLLATGYSATLPQGAVRDDLLAAREVETRQGWFFI
jgi:hypothetical protein